MPMYITLKPGPGQSLLAFIPSPIGEEVGHHVEIPLTIEGLRVLSKMVHARGNMMPKIGNEGSPTQHDIREWLRGMKEEITETAKQLREEKRLAAREEAVKSLGRTYAGIDLNSFKL